MTLGDRLRKARERRGWNQRYVSSISKISNTALSNYERNYRDPDTETLKKLADLYGVSVDWLTGRTSKTEYTTPAQTESEFILREIVQKYNLDLTIPGNKEKLEKLIEIVLDEPKNK
jgi:transcriptional regulator with XRE-family HTH domain